MPGHLPGGGRAKVILVDTSIWIDHLRTPSAALRELLDRRQVATHAFIVGELSLGGIAARAARMRDLNRLPRILLATNAEVAALIEWGKLFGTGLGYVDAHLLAALRLDRETALWTRDKRFKAQAERLDLALYG